MTQIRAFKAVHYNPKKIKDLSEVVCPPYDVISPEAQTAFHNAHPNNFIRILLGMEKSKDNSYDNKYTRAKKIFAEWMKKGILVQDDKPCFYVYKQEYKVCGQKKTRIGFLALMRLQDKEKSKIYPHENTHKEAKKDRLRLWRNVKANLSPIFVCFSDQYKRIENIFHDFSSQKEPIIDIIDQDQVRHIVSRLDDPISIEKVKNLIDGQQLFIADGHHRYEVAMEYRKSRMKRKKRTTGKESFNYIMTYMTNLDSRDLVILPIHRVVKKFPSKTDFLEEFFRIDKIKDVEQLKILLGKAGKNEHAFGLYTRDGIKLLRLKNRMLIDQHIHEGSREFQHLDATILKTLVFDRVKITSDNITYKKDLDEAVKMVDSKKAAACFVLNSVGVEQLKSIALNGEKMPPKTTYFYPKVLSGLTIYKMDK
ncbi:MAG: DUF1015 domain-containing protein [Candidatus Omnitrophica bacterium]|nr:DUF1015 domain-containing protein [Candidatus Omnitrophota bacterium]